MGTELHSLRTPAGPLDVKQWEHVSDEELVRLVLSGDTALYEILMRRYNQRIYRIVMTIVRNDAEAEDVMEEAYVRAYQHLGDFAGRAKFSTWLTKIAIYEAMDRVRYQAKHGGSGPTAEDGSVDFMNTVKSGDRDPETQAYDREL